MIQNAKLLASVVAIAAIIVVQSPVRTLANEAAQLITTSDEVLTAEFSATTKKQQHVNRRSATSGGTHKTAKVSTRGHKTAKVSTRGHKIAKVSTRGHKPAKVGTGPSKVGAPNKVGTGPSKIGTGPSKIGTSTGKLTTGPGKSTSNAATGGLQAGPGKRYENKMGPAKENNKQPANDPKQAGKDNKKPKNDPNTPKDDTTVIVIPNINLSGPPVVFGGVPSGPRIVIDGVPPRSVLSPGPNELAAPAPASSADCLRVKNEVNTWMGLLSQANASLVAVQNEMVNDRDMHNRLLSAATTEEARQSRMRNWSATLADYGGRLMGLNQELRNINARLADLSAQQLEACT